MKIAIIGTRGVPNRYGGFEQLAEKLSVGLFQKGHSVSVYNSHRHSYKEKKFKGVDIIHCYDPEHRLGTPGQFIYDLNCVRDARKKDFDVLLFLGYTSSSVWGKLYPKKTVIISNMDGLEWKRTKYAKPAQRFLEYAEKLAVQFSHYLIADSVAIQQYLQHKFGVNSRFIPYGAELFSEKNEQILTNYELNKEKYFMLMARMEPENNIEMILNGFHNSNSSNKFIVIGNTVNSFGKYITGKFGADQRIIFAGAIYDQSIIHNLIHFSKLYFHGHSVGGTNPSLLEAMAAGAMIAVHDNEFNRAVTGDNAYYFNSAKDIQQLIESGVDETIKEKMTASNLEKIRHQYNWPAVIDQYEDYISSCYSNQIK